MKVNRPEFLNPSGVPPLPPTKLSIAWSTYRKVNAPICAFACVILLSALLYYVGSRQGWGIVPTFPTPSSAHNQIEATRVSFADCLYFSVVTIATLGYGDYRPQSFGRVVAAIEVISGIVLMGLFVSRLVSHQQDRLTKRLVTGQLNTEIQNFRDKLARLLREFGSAPLIDRTRESEVLYRASGLSLSIARYWRHEAQQPDLTDVIQLRAASRLLGGLFDLLEAVDKFVDGKSRLDVYKDDRNYIRNITDATLVVSTILSERLHDPGLNHSHERVLQIVGKLRKQFVLHEYDY